MFTCSGSKARVAETTSSDDAVKQIIKIYVNVPTASFSTDLLFPCGVPTGGTVSLIVGDFSKLRENSHCEKIPLAPFVLKQKLVINTPNSDGKPLCIPKPCNAAWSLESFWKCLTPNEGTVTLSAKHLGIEDNLDSHSEPQRVNVDGPDLDKYLPCPPDPLSEDDTVGGNDTQAGYETDDEEQINDLQVNNNSQVRAPQTPPSTAKKRTNDELTDDQEGVTIFRKKIRADTLLSDVSSGSDESECSVEDDDLDESENTGHDEPSGLLPEEANFVCGLCDRGFPSRGLCQQHVWSHVPLIEKVYECSSCESTFTTAFAQDRHEKTCHVQKIHHPCATCNEVFNTPRDLEKHSWIHRSKITVYCCEYCGWQFMLKVHYDLHIAHNHNTDVEASDVNSRTVQNGANPDIQIFPCTLCSLIFQSEEQCEKHKESKHEVKLVTRDTRQFYVCPVCSKHISASFYIFNKHMAVHRHPERTPNPKFRCSECGTQLLTLGGYRGHMALHKETEPHCCEQCPRTFRTAFYLRKHTENVHATDLKYTCRFCPRKFVDEKKLRLHLAVLHENLLNDDERLAISSLKVYPCDHCSFTTYSQKVIKNHISGHTGEYPFHCSECKKGYSYKYQLTQHMAMTHMSEGGKCGDCGRVFYNDVSFQRHKEVHASNRGFECEHCKKVYESEGLRRRHVTDNHEGEPGSHKCDVCGKSFDLATSLRLHKRSAHESRMAKRPSRRFSTGLICDICGVDFKFVGSLEAHKVVKHNTAEGQDIICPYCEKKSSSQLALSLHMRIHFNEKPFKCKYCKKEFTLHASCKSHEQRHERKKKFVCPHCECEFFFESKLNRHLMAFHSALYDEQVAIVLGHVINDEEDVEASQAAVTEDEENGEEEPLEAEASVEWITANL